ncbi:MAG TPA: hypothetical protein V6C63_21615 [Allocoleopsis sp.]
MTIEENKVRKGKIADLIPDTHNGNKGTERGRYMLEASVRRNGVGRGVLADKHGRLIGGNKTHEVVGALGIEDVIIVPTYGDTLVVTQRMDLDLEEDAIARELAWADNRVQEVSYTPDIENLQIDIDAGVELDPYWTPGELTDLVEGKQEEEEQEERDRDGERCPNSKPVECPHCGQTFIPE